MRYAFYISKRSKRLCDFLNQAPDSVISNIMAVISDNKLEYDTKSTIENKHIPIIEFDYLELRGSTNAEKNLELSNKILEVLHKINIDYMFSFGRHILAGDLLEVYKYRIINFHPAILPMYPGINAIDQAVAHGNTLLVGNTAHFIDEGVDTGKIIMQSVIPLQAFFDSGCNYDLVLNLAIAMLNQIISLLNSERIQIIDDKVRIIGADYSKSYIFPYLPTEE